MKQIVCGLSQFTLNHPVYFIDEDGNNTFVEDVTIDEAVYRLYELGNEKQTFNYHLFGMIDYIRPYGEALARKIMSEYKDRDFSIEYN